MAIVTSVPPSRKYLRSTGWLALALSVVVGLWAGLTPKLAGVDISPRKVYRLEYYDVSPLLRLLLYRDMESPSIVRLYRRDPEALMGESSVVDLWINGQLYWYLDPPISSVRVGRDVVFRNIPPECTDCPPLTDAQVMP